MQSISSFHPSNKDLLLYLISWIYFTHIENLILSHIYVDRAYIFELRLNEISRSRQQNRYCTGNPIKVEHEPACHVVICQQDRGKDVDDEVMVT